MQEIGKKIILNNTEYTIFEHDTAGIPYYIIDEKNVRYFLQLKDDRSDKYHVVDGLFRFKFIVTKEELKWALNPPIEWKPGGIIGSPTTGAFPNVIYFP